MRRRLWQLVSVMLASLAPACLGTSTGNPGKPDAAMPDSGPAEATAGSCDDTTTKLPNLDAVSSLGFSAADMLALAQDHESTSIEWLARGSSVSYGPESGTGTLQIEIESRDAQARFVDRRPKMPSATGGPEITLGGGELYTPCADTVELDVSVHISSGGGALDERFDAILSAKGPNVARIYVQRKATDLTGSFEAHLVSDARAILESVQFDVAFSKLGPSGQLGVGFTQPAPVGSADASNSVSSSSLNPGPIARWPANASCDAGGFAARVDQRVDRFSAKDGVDRFNAVNLQLSAAGASPTKLHVNFAPGSAACALLEDEREPVPSVAVSGELSLRSEDGRIDGKWPMMLSASAAADGSLGSVKVAYDLHGSIIASLVDATAFESTYGIHGFDMTSYDQAGIVLTLTVGPDAAVSGELVVNGVKRPACQTQAAPTPDSGSGAPGQSTAPCAGLQFTQVWTATIGAGH